MSEQSFPGIASKVLVRLVLKNFSLMPKEIDACLGVGSTYALQKGDRRNPKAAPAQTNLWVLESDDNNRLDAEVQLRNLLGKLGSFKELRALDPNVSAHVSCVVYFIGDDSRPTIGLTADMMVQLGAMNCAFDVDYYLFSKGSENAPY